VGDFACFVDEDSWPIKTIREILF